MIEITWATTAHPNQHDLQDLPAFRCCFQASPPRVSSLVTTWHSLAEATQIQWASCHAQRLIWITLFFQGRSTCETWLFISKKNRFNDSNGVPVMMFIQISDLAPGGHQYRGRTCMPVKIGDGIFKIRYLIHVNSKHIQTLSQSLCSFVNTVFDPWCEKGHVKSLPSWSFASFKWCVSGIYISDIF